MLPIVITITCLLIASASSEFLSSAPERAKRTVSNWVDRTQLFTFASESIQEYSTNIVPLDDDFELLVSAVALANHYGKHMPVLVVKSWRQGITDVESMVNVMGNADGLSAQTFIDGYVFRNMFTCMGDKCVNNFDVDARYVSNGSQVMVTTDDLPCIMDYFREIVRRSEAKTSIVIVADSDHVWPMFDAGKRKPLTRDFSNKTDFDSCNTGGVTYDSLNDMLYTGEIWSVFLASVTHWKQYA